MRIFVGTGVALTLKNGVTRKFTLLCGGAEWFENG